MDELGRVLVLVSVNDGDSAPSYRAFYCVHLTAQRTSLWSTWGFSELTKSLFKCLTVISSMSQFMDYSTGSIPV